MIEHVDYHITDHCNLNCAGCNQFGTLAKPWSVSYEQFCEEWNNVKKSGLTFGEIRILGGETLLHPEIDKLLIFLRELFPTTSIVVYTNATFLEKLKEKLIPVFNKLNIILHISIYPNTNLDYNTLAQGFNNVRYSSGNYFMHTSLHTNPDFDQEVAFKTCYTGSVWKCRFLKDNKIYACSMLPNMCHLIQYYPELKETPLGKMKIEDNGLDIREHTVEEIEQFLNKSMSACTFCDTKAAKTMYPWSRSCYDIKEWIDK